MITAFIALMIGTARRPRRGARRPRFSSRRHDGAGHRGAGGHAARRPVPAVRPHLRLQPAHRLGTRRGDGVLPGVRLHPIRARPRPAAPRRRRRRARRHRTARSVLVLPAAVPHIASGLRIAAGSAVIAAVVGESLIGRQGLGVEFAYSYRHARPAPGVRRGHRHRRRLRRRVRPRRGARAGRPRPLGLTPDHRRRPPTASTATHPPPRPLETDHHVLTQRSSSTVGHPRRDDVLSSSALLAACGSDSNDGASSRHGRHDRRIGGRHDGRRAPWPRCGGARCSTGCPTSSGRPGTSPRSKGFFAEPRRRVGPCARRAEHPGGRPGARRRRRQHRAVGRRARDHQGQRDGGRLRGHRRHVPAVAVRLLLAHRDRDHRPGRPRGQADRLACRATRSGSTRCSRSTGSTSTTSSCR